MTQPIKYTHFLVLTMASITMLMATVSYADKDQTYARILVTGQGAVDIAPDMAILSLTVTREADTARAALDANSSAMSEVLSALKAEGIEARDLQTSGFSIQPKYIHPGAKSSGERQPPRIVGYTVRNSLSVRVRDISNVGAILDTSVTLGVNQGGNITFTNADPSAVITQARIEAVKDAKSKAETLARAAGVDVGHLMEISEQSFSPRPMPMARAEMSMARMSDAVPVASGENTYKVNVNVSYAIEQ